MKIRKGDKVKILSGKDKGKTGSVTKVLPKKEKIVVENVNLLTKHQRPKKQGEKGTKIKFAAPLNMSNAILVCPKCGKETRVGFIMQDKNKLRQCKKCKESF